MRLTVTKRKTRARAVKWFRPVCHRAETCTHSLTLSRPVPHDRVEPVQLEEAIFFVFKPCFAIAHTCGPGNARSHLVLTKLSAESVRSAGTTARAHVAPVQLGDQPVTIAAVDGAHVLNDVAQARLR